MPADGELLRRYSEDRSEAAFAELVRRHLDFVYSVALRNVGGDAHHAHDVTQRVFVDLARKAKSLSRHPILNGWLYQSSRFAAIDLVRSEQRRRIREQKAQAMDQLISDSSAPVEGDSLRPMLDRAIGELSDRDRNVVLLRFFEGRAFAEIGAALHLTEDAARMQAERALKKMKVLLARRGITSTTAALALGLASQTVVAAPAGMAAAVTSTALASTAIVGSSALSLWQVLANAKMTIGVSTAIWAGGIAGVSTIGALFYEFREAQRAHHALAVAAAEREVQMARLNALESSLRTAAKNRNEFLAKADALNAKSAAAAEESNPRAEGQKLLAGFPQARALLMAAGIPRVAERYQAFYRLANLTPAQIERFEHLMTATWVDSVTVDPTGANAGTVVPTGEQLRAVLGDQDYRQFQNYNQMQYAYQFTDYVAAQVNLAGEPLSTGQIDQLARIIADSSSFYRDAHNMNQGAANFAETAASVDWDGVMTQAKGILSPAQWSAAQSPLLNAQLEVTIARAQAGQIAVKTTP